jgi:hypothetical protein
LALGTEVRHPEATPLAVAVAQEPGDSAISLMLCLVEEDFSRVVAVEQVDIEIHLDNRGLLVEETLRQVFTLHSVKLSPGEASASVLTSLRQRRMERKGKKRRVLTLKSRRVSNQVR